ncbi:metal ABC transporter substrate-binding protein [Sporosarcina sp. 179-K 3D1 HS]|uniref:metal ABC transporter substrate-binding protein n=1 Tax=Sporosarcina sp. 179-K 3D1 HS TaxID=3232169 RepID=UPI0039A2C16D
MKRWISVLSSILLVAFLTACGKGSANSTGEAVTDSGANEEKLKIITTYSIIYDMVKNVGGDLVDIHSLAPIGSDPHNYDPLPQDVVLTTDADIVFYNGLNLEEGNGWFNKLMVAANKSDDDAPVFKVSEGVTPMYLKSEEHAGEEDPHAWLDVRNGIRYVENIRDILSKMDPDHASVYEENASRYISQLEDLHEGIKDKMSQVPEGKRILVTSEGAFKYFSAAYDFEAAYIWEINSHDEGTPEQLKRIVDIIKENGIPALFVETSVDTRSMETVSRETNVPIQGEIFTDSLGKPGTDGDTYMDMVKWNADMIYNGLVK